MDARTGKKIRLARLFDRRSRRTLIVAYSHGVLMGPGRGMATLDEMRRVTASLGKANGLMVSPGMVTPLEEAFLGKDRPSLVIHLDYQSFSRSLLPYEQGSTVELAGVEQALAAGAEAVMTYLYLGYSDSEREKMEIGRNARVARECERSGLVLMVEPRSARESAHPEDKADPSLLAMYCRIAAEIGADLVKCIHPGSLEGLKQVVAGCPAAVLVAGGARAVDAEAARQRAREAMAAGAAGLVYGRNIYQADDPGAELDCYLQIVHGET